MRIRDLYGQATAKRQLSRSLANGQVSHAYLFGGPPGSGKKTAALAWAQALNCLDPVEGDACGLCLACEKIEKGNHPDVLWVEPEGDSFRLEQVREVRRRTVYSPYEGRHLVVVLCQSDQLTLEAGNALLKLLEDPVAGNVFVLVSDRPAEVLPTVMSRCQVVSFHPLSYSLVVSFLKVGGAGAADAEWLARLAHGDLTRAKELLTGAAEVGKERSILLGLWAKIWRGSRLDLMGIARELAAKDGELVIGMFLEWLRDAWVWWETGRKELLYNSDLLTHLPVAAPPRRQLFSLRRLLADARKSLGRNAQKQLVWEVLLLRWPCRVAGEESPNW